MTNGIFGWSQTAASNATQDSINFAEGQAPSTVNDSARGLMSIVAKYLYDNSGQITTGGSANAQTATTGTGFTALNTGLMVALKAGYTNSGATTLNVDALGAKAVYLNGTALAGGEIVTGGVYIYAYNSTLNGGAGAWQLLNPTVTLSDGSITTAKLAANAATVAKLAYGAWSNVASAATVDLGAQTTRNIVITGTTTIMSFGSTATADNAPFFVRFAAALTLTYNASTLIIPGAANITTAAGDFAIIVQETTGNWRVVEYIRAAMTGLVAGTSANNLVQLDASAKIPAIDGSQITGLIKDGSSIATTSGTSKELGSIPSTARRVVLILNGVSTNGTSGIDIRVGSGSLASTGYSGAGSIILNGTSPSVISRTSGAYVNNTTAANNVSGRAVFTKVTGNTWHIEFVGAIDGVANILVSSAIVTLGGVLDRVGVASWNGTDAFDAGSIAMTWE